MIELGLIAIFIQAFYFLMKKISRSKIIKELDAVFSRYIRLRNCSSDGIVICPLCGTKVPRKKAQNMHFISRANMKYRYDEDNCHAGCMRCNVILHGNYIIYTRRMIRRYGMDKVNKMIDDKEVCKIPTRQLEERIEYYKLQVEKLKRKKHLC